jgi:hypothetical protein
MPITFDDFGIRFLYPDNWLIQSRESDDESDNVTLEMPNGGFFSVTKYRVPQTIDAVLEPIAVAMKNEYPEVEIEELDSLDDDSDSIEFRFYYLDLLIVARVIAMVIDETTLVIQVQAESRDFDAGEPVYNAMLKSIRDGMENS